MRVGDLSNSDTKIVISIDLMGGDNAPEVPLVAISQVIKENKDINFLAFGLQNTVEPILSKLNISKDRFHFKPSDSVIREEDKPSLALRKHKNTSISDAIKAVAEGKASAVVSAGNTGAVMAIAIYLLKVIDSIDRPAVLALIPRINGRACLLDVGANAVCQARHLQDFAMLGSRFAQVLLGKSKPTIGLLNIGKEDTKGTELVKSTHELLLETELNYVGFVEANGLLTGDVDVIVTDGFSGNVALKAMEGAGSFCLRMLKKAAGDSLMARLGLALFKLFGGTSAADLDPNEYNGGVLLGLNGIVVKSHGAANIKAFKTCINHAIAMSQRDLIGKLQQKGSLADD